MARGLSQVILDELAAEEMFPFSTLDFSDDDNNYKYTTLDVPITLTGTPSGTYIPRGFKLENIKYNLSNVMDSCSLRIDNLDSVLTSIFVAGSVEGKIASVYLGVMNVSGGVIESLLAFTGEVDSFKLDESEVEMTIGSIFTKWINQAFNKNCSSCRWKKFKGNRCGYSGLQNLCDRSYTRCTTLGNTANFGGFRWLPEIENKEVNWGPIPSERRAELEAEYE